MVRREREKTLGASAFWFAALGGAIAWILQLGIAWAVTETTCLSGHDRINGIPLTWFIAVAIAVPGVFAAVAAVIAWRGWRTSDPGGRVHLVTGVGLFANLLFLAIIVFDGAALLVFPSCLT